MKGWKEQGESAWADSYKSERLNLLIVLNSTLQVQFVFQMLEYTLTEQQEIIFLVANLMVGLFEGRPLIWQNNQKL